MSKKNNDHVVCVDKKGIPCEYCISPAENDRVGDKGKRLYAGCLYCGYGARTRLVTRYGEDYSNQAPDWCPINHNDGLSPDGNLHCKISPKGCHPGNGERLCCWFCDSRDKCKDVCHNFPSKCGQGFTTEVPNE